MRNPALDSYGTVRRVPAPSFAHVIKLDQGADFDEARGKPRSPEWILIDLYGPMGDMMSDEEVQDYPVVYVPMLDYIWAEGS